MRALQVHDAVTRAQIVSSIYEICLFGNGTVSEAKRKFVNAKVIPSYLQSKWMRFNKFGLNKTKVENHFVMFFAHATTIALDLVLLPIAASAGQAQIQLIPILVKTGRLFLQPISKLLLQEYLEHQFESRMFAGATPVFLTKTKEIEEFILNRHRVDFTIKDEYLNLLKKFSELPMLHFIFFHAQMTNEYIIYRKSFLNKESIPLETKEQIENYFKTVFRMMRFFHHSEVHALNYFFVDAFSNITNFYSNTKALRNKFNTVFYSDKKPEVEEDIRIFLSILNHKIQMDRGGSEIKKEMSDAAIIQFQYFYFDFFMGNDDAKRQIIHFFDTKAQLAVHEPIYEDSLRINALYNYAKDYIVNESLSHVTNPTACELRAKTTDLLKFISETLTNVNSADRAKQLNGILMVLGIAGLVGAVVGGVVLSKKYHTQIEKFITCLASKTIQPLSNIIKVIDDEISNTFKLNSRILNSSANRVLGSIVFIAGHFPTSSIGGVLGFFADISSFNPLNSFILRTAENYTKARLEKRDYDILHTVDSHFRLGYNVKGILGVKIQDVDNYWIDNFDIDLVDERLLNFMTHDFARVVRHKSKTIGILYEQIANLDREIEIFQKAPFEDIFYCFREKAGPVYTSPVCRIDMEITRTILENKAKKRFFDILIERQILLAALINCAYYINLYQLFIQRIKMKCLHIFNTDLPFTFEKMGMV